MTFGIPLHEKPLDEWLAVMLYEASQHRGYRPTVGERLRCAEILGSAAWGRFVACYVDQPEGLCIIRKDFIPKLVDRLQDAATHQVTQRLEA